MKVKVKQAFFKACELGEIEKINSFLNETPDAHKAFSGGMQAIHFASRYNHPESISLLIARGADLNGLCENGMSAVSIATHYGAFESLRTLIARGADLNKPDNSGNSPLVWALKKKPEIREEAVKLLLAAGANYGISEAICKGDTETVRSIIEKNPNAVHDIHQPPEVLLRIISFGRFEGETPERVEIFKLLTLQRGSKSNIYACVSYATRLLVRYAADGSGLHGLHASSPKFGVGIAKFLRIGHSGLGILARE